ncbi:MAG TPA: nucleoside-diphosphate kinase [Planctomycetota bacterium]|jgi:nucleoside-diphosphate kinase|nr:nucleoside-diphosphate kinase [Planctomycetota bacterium]
MERTLVLLKPDAVQRFLVGRILQRFEEKGLQIVGLRMLRLAEADARRLYEPHAGKPFYEGLVRFMTASPIVALALEGKNSIAIVRKLLGATFGSKAEPGTIRGDFGVSDSFNLVHGSDGPESASRELPILFAARDLLAWEPKVLPWIYDLPAEFPRG